MECVECYSENNRITPLLKSRNCLEKHRQYVCGTCGRCICIDKDEKRNVARWNFPFKSLEIAKLYLRTADFMTKKSCGVYEILGIKDRKFYKIFASIEGLNLFLHKNKDKICESKKPVLIKESYNNFSNTKIKFLDACEIEKYLLEQRLQVFDCVVKLNTAIND